MRLIEEFIEKVMTTDKSFQITEGCNTSEKYYLFVPCNVGNARYIYGSYAYYDVNFSSSLNLQPKLVAIVINDTVYVVDPFLLDVYRVDVILPEKVKFMNANKENTFVNEIAFPKFYESLPVNDITDINSIRKLTEQARNILFSKSGLLMQPTIEPLFNLQDVANMLCGFINLEEETDKRLNANKEKWIYEKSVNAKINELMNDASIVKEWELQIAGGLRSIDAKTVIVEFELNGMKESIKINPNKIIGHLVDNDYFDCWDFEVAKQGAKLLKNLKAGTHRADNNALRCNHITMITFGKKVLYEREDENTKDILKEATKNLSSEAGRVIEIGTPVDESRKSPVYFAIDEFHENLTGAEFKHEIKI